MFILHDHIFNIALSSKHILGMGQSRLLGSVYGVSILSVILFAGTLSITGFSSQPNEVINDTIQGFTFGSIQFASATHVADSVLPEISNYGVSVPNVFSSVFPTVGPLFLNGNAEEFNIVGKATDDLSGVETVEIKITMGAVLVSDFEPVDTIDEDGDFSYGVSLVGEPDGLYTFTARATDEAENSVEVSGDVLMDRIPPTMDSAITTSTTTVDVTFSEDLGGSTISASDFTIDGVAALAAVESSPGVVSLTGADHFGQFADSTNGRPDIELVGEVSDVAGNTLSSALIENAADGVPPEIRFAAHFNTPGRITMQFTEIINSAESDATLISAFTVTNPTAVINSISGPDSSNTINLFTDINDSFSTPDVSFDSSLATITDHVAGNALGDFTEQATDQVRPSVVDVDVSPEMGSPNITDNNASDVGETDGDNALTITVTYDEPMRTHSSLIPSFAFIDPVPNASTFTLDETASGWNSPTNTIFTAVFDVTDNNEEVGKDSIDDIDVTITGAQDAPANLQNPHTEADVIEIDTRNPLVVSETTVAVSATLINDALIASPGIFNVTIDYDEAMITDGTANPTITFDTDISSTLGASPSSDEWLDSDTYRATYTLADNEVFIDLVDIDSIVGAKDLATNVQVDYLDGITAGPFTIDTQNPVVIVPTEIRREGDNTSNAVPINFTVNSNDIENPEPTTVDCWNTPLGDTSAIAGVGPDIDNNFDFIEAFSFDPGTDDMTCRATDEHGNTSEDTFQSLVSEILEVQISNVSPFWDEVITVNGTAFGFKVGEIINVTNGIDPLIPFDEIVIPEEADSNAGFFFEIEHAFSFVTSNTTQTVEVDLVNNPIEASAVPQDVDVQRHFTEFVSVSDIGTDHWGKLITKSGTLVDLQASIGPEVTGSLNPSANILISGDGKGTLPFSTTTDVDGFFSVSGNSVSRTIEAPSTVAVNVDYLGDQFFVPALQVTDPYSTLIHPTTLILNPVESVQGGNPVTVAGQLTDNITGEIIPDQTIEFSATAGIILSSTSTTGPVTISDGFDIDSCSNCSVATQLLRLGAGDSITFTPPTPETVVLPLRDMAENDILASVTAEDGSVFPAVGDGKGDNTGNWRISHGSGIARIDIDSITGTGVSGIREIQLLNEHSASTFTINFNGFATDTYDILSFDDVNYDSVGTSPTGEETPFSVTASFDGTSDFDGSTSAAQNSVLQSSAGASSSALPSSVISDSGVGITSVSCEGNDTDGDALCNDWEGAGNGVPYEVDGITYRYELTGTSTTTKDLLLEIDSHDFHAPHADTLVNVTNAFSNAPTGAINLITDVDDNIPHVSLIKVWKDSDNDFTNDFSGIKSKWFGTSTERVSINETPSLDFDNQILMYNFDGNTVDSTSPNQDGLVFGSTTYAVGKMGRAFDFDGATLIGQGGTSTWKALHEGSSTIAVWLKSSDISNTPVFVDTSNGGSFGAVGMTLFARPSGELNYQITNGGGTGPVVSIVAPAAFIADGEWHHYLVSFDESLASNNAKLYVDGVLTAQATKVQSSSTSNHAKGLEIGGLGFCCKFNGEMDDLRFYDYALSGSQSANLHTSAEGSDISLAQLAYEFDGNSLADSIGSNTALVFGSTTYDTNGAFGDAFRLDGSNFVYTPQISSLFIDDSVTISIWFNPATAGVIVDERGQDPPFDGWNDAYVEILATGEVKARVWPIAPISLGTASFNEWHHVVLRYNGATDTLDGFLDGKKSLSASGDRQAPQEFCCWQQYFAFGKSDTLNMGSGAALTGLIDDIRIYNTALSDTEISKLFIKKVPLGSQANISGLTLTTPSNSVTGDKTEGRINVRLVATTAADTTFNADSSGTSTVTGGDSVFTFETPIISTSSTGTPTQKSLQVSIPYLTSSIASSDNIGTIKVPLWSSKSVTGLSNDAGSPTASSTLLDAKAQAYRYILFTHSIGGQSGQAELRGNDGIVALGDGFSGTVAGHTGTVGTIDEQSGTLLHELGHMLNLNHGGPRYLLSDPNTSLVATVENCVPFHNSVMSYTGQFPTYKGNQWVLSFSNLNSATLNENGLVETAGYSIPGSPFLLWSTSGPGALQPYLSGFADGTGKDWSGTGLPLSSIAANYDLNNFGIFGCKASSSSSFVAHSEWANLDFDFRKGPTGQFDASYPQVFPPGQAESINVGVQQQIIANYQTHGVESPLKADGTANIKPKSNVNVRIDLDNREGNFLNQVGGNALVVTGFYSIDGGNDLQPMVDKDGNEVFNIKTITGSGGNPDKDVWELQWRTPDLSQGNNEVTVWLYLRINNPGATPDKVLVFDKTSSTYPEISIANNGKVNERTNAFVFTDDQGNRATVKVTMKKGGP